jgi:hypothetical protein
MWKIPAAPLAALATAVLIVGCIGQPVVEPDTANNAATKGTSQPMNGQKLSGWDVAIVTSGGISGRGLGDISLSSSGTGHVSDPLHGCDVKVDAKELDEIAAHIAAARTSRWQDSYASPANPHGYADQIRFELTLSRVVNGEPGKRTTFWYDENLDTLPPDLAALQESVWGMREKLLEQCGK